MKLFRFLPFYIFFLALFIRLVFLGLTYHGQEEVRYWDDVCIASNLLDGKGYSTDFKWRNYNFYEVPLNKKIKDSVTEGHRPTASKAPVYPLLLASIFLIFGLKNFLALFVLQAILSAFTCLLTFLSLDIYSRKIAFLSGLGMALYPPFAFHSVTVVEPTTLLLFLISLFIFYAIKLRKILSNKAWILVGTIGGLMALTEPVTILFTIPALGYSVYFSKGTRRGNLIRSFFALMAALIVISPWPLRNYLVFNHFVLFKSGVGVALMWGLEKSGTGNWVPEETLLDLEIRGRKLNEMEEEMAIREILFPLFVKNLKEYITINLPGNFAHFWWETKDYKKNDSLKYMLGRKMPYLLLLFLALPSLCRSIYNLMRSPRAGLTENIYQNMALLLTLAYTFNYTVFGAWLIRYHFPVELVMFSFFGETLSYLQNTVFKMVKKQDTFPSTC